ncbi:uncharacterized protein [Nicotiana tomentosiformis]|uniref:uncharacterized protein n=1 Tax=Nicotiana tomentosiformis TaxID=4098 RepID=UPI00388CA3C3
MFPYTPQQTLYTPEPAEKDLLIKNMAEELKKLHGSVRSVEGGKSIEGLNYKDLCNQLDVELPEGYKPPKFEMFDCTPNPKAHLRTYCDKLVGMGKNEQICMKLFMRSLTGDALAWFRFNIENAPDVFYIQNLKKKPMETFCGYATHSRSKKAKVRPPLEEEQINKFFMRAQDLQYYDSYITIILAVATEILAMWINPNKTCVCQSGMKGHTIEECRTLKDKIQMSIDTKVIHLKEPTPNVHNNPLPNHRGDGINMIETNEQRDQEGSVGFIRDGDTAVSSPIVPMPVVVQDKAPFEVEVAIPRLPFTMMVASSPAYHPKVMPWDYVAEARRKGKAMAEEEGVAQVMTRTGRVYTPENLDQGGSSEKTAPKPPVVETGIDNLWRKVQAKEYSVNDHLNKNPAQISILSLLKNSYAHKNSLMKVSSDSYVLVGITSGEMANMVGQILETHKITFHEDELPPEGLIHNRALHITVQYEDKFITRVLVDGGSSLNICPLTTLRRLGIGTPKIRQGSMAVKAFDGS